MYKLKKMIPILFLISLIYALIVGCGPTVIATKPPPYKTEVKPAKPYPNAVWMSGHWKWTGGNYVWVPGHWVKPRAGKKWVPGHWQKRPRGWVWVKGHWR
jgi:hypothetical protein